jgi:SAM-dependent methyltransferase
MNKYRERIYGHYVTSAKDALAPDSVSGLEGRRPLLQDIIKRHIPSDKQLDIIELGCGYGVFQYFLQKAGYRNAVGIDVSDEQVAAAKRLGIENVRQGDVMESLARMADDSVDIIIAFDLIEHFTKSELIDLVDEVCRVLRDDGRWIIHTPNADSPFFGSIRYGDMTHELAFNQASITQLLSSSGYQRIDCFEDKPLSAGLKGVVRSLMWKVVRFFLRFYTLAETGSPQPDGIFSRNFLVVAHKRRDK